MWKKEINKERGWRRQKENWRKQTRKKGTKEKKKMKGMKERKKKGFIMKEGI